MRIAIILPTYNERENIKKMIPLLEKKIFPQIKNHQMDILVVDDKSPDQTAEQVRSFMKKWKNIKLLEGDKKGLGFAYVRGMKHAIEDMKVDAVMEFDADFQHDPRDIPRLIKALDKGADHVIGSRYIKGGSIPKEWRIERKFLSIFGNLFTRFIWLNFNIHDMTSGFKLTKTSFIKKVDLDNLFSNNFAYKMHILHDVIKAKAKVVEVPIKFLERENGKSKISKKDQFESFYVVTRLGIYDRKRFVKFLIVGGTGFLIQILTQEITINVGFALFIAGFISILISYFFPHSDINSLSQGVGAGFGAEAAILSNFMFNNFWTFSDTNKIKDSSHFLIKLFKFNSTSFASIVIQSLAVWLGVKVFGDNLNILGYIIPIRILIVIPTIIFLVIPLNYIIYNKIIWKTHRLKKISN